MEYESKYIWMDGKLVEFANATVHFLNATMHYGAGVFEGIRCYDTPHGPAVFRLQDHVRRLIDSAKILGFREVPYTQKELSEAIKLTIRANGFLECYIRPLIFMGNVNASLNLDNSTANIGIAVWEWNSYLGEDANLKGVRANVSSYTRHHINVAMTKAKITGNYTNSMMAKTESVRLGFDEAIMLDPQGYVAECSGENLFLVRHQKIYTPPLATVLEGITRDTAITLARDEGFEVIEQPVSRDMLYIADEVFVSGSAAELVAIREIDFRTIGSGKMGPVTRRLQEQFHAAIHGDHLRSSAWLENVD
jgi:branched-chain amino acid aminotransferase